MNVQIVGVFDRVVEYFILKLHILCHPLEERAHAAFEELRYLKLQKKIEKLATLPILLIASQW
jgi:hypothetical protein